MIVYRVQDADGRGPYKPGFSRHWVEPRDDLEHMPNFIKEFGPLDLPRGMHCGCACESIKALRRWFTPREYGTLVLFGYRAVRIEVDRIIAASDLQCVFARRKALRLDVQEVALYAEVVTA